MRVLLAPGLLAITVAGFGCASTRFEKTPGEHDHGIRYYRPKPYLQLQPEDGTNDPNVVRMDLKWLPDFSEQYSVHVRAGIGINHTVLTFENGWNLKQVDVTLDSQVTEFINALAGLLATSPKLLAGGAEPPAMTDTRKSVTVCAYDVPLGLYESVIGRGPDGKKRLYGWRYVGFAPYANCPIDAQGVDRPACDQMDLYGLVTIEGKLYFRKLSEMAQTTTQVKITNAGP